LSWQSLTLCVLFPIHHKKRRTSLPLPKFICLRYLQFHLFCFQRITISERSAARSARLPLSIRISAASVPAVILPFLLQDEGWVLRFFRKFMHEQLPFRIFISSPRITFMTPGTSVLSIGKIFIITHSSRRFLLSSARSSLIRTLILLFSASYSTFFSASSIGTCLILRYSIIATTA